jgi:hypothetical protein
VQCGRCHRRSPTSPVPLNRHRLRCLCTQLPEGARIAPGRPLDAFAGGWRQRLRATRWPGCAGLHASNFTGKARHTPASASRYPLASNGAATLPPPAARLRAHVHLHRRGASPHNLDKRGLGVGPQTRPVNVLRFRADILISHFTSGSGAHGSQRADQGTPPMSGGYSRPRRSTRS